MSMFPCNHADHCDDCRKKTSLVDNMEGLLLPYIREQASKNPHAVDRMQVIHAVSDERDYQEIRWPGHRHEIEAYLTYIRKYIDRMEDKLSFNDMNDVKADVLHDLRKVIALGVACAEEHGIEKRVLNPRQQADIDTRRALSDSHSRGKSRIILDFARRMCDYP